MSEKCCIHCKGPEELKTISYYVASGRGEQTWSLCKNSDRFGLECSRCKHTFHSYDAPVPGSFVKCPSCNHNAFNY
ncbi:hypothetical protein [Polaribacter aquimarinus]|uniref:hypothetical protein n=1 Tax=Polaribacter aquimarinus TaxID=2100726 RepID=UPI0011B1CB4E|nr:hypothetical protein [Polaribacter aquimarinus]